MVNNANMTPTPIGRGLCPRVLDSETNIENLRNQNEVVKILPQSPHFAISTAKCVQSHGKIGSGTNIRQQSHRYSFGEVSAGAELPS